HDALPISPPSDPSMRSPLASRKRVQLRLPRMRVLAIVHQPDAGPGVFAEEMRSRGIELEEWALSQRGQGPPREIAEYDAVMTFGGAMNVDEEDKHPWVRFEKDFL